ncbi:MAG: DegV family EDD domain-containing protein [Deltaproteobacteria bacterium]|nr:DegV family EDD domain-containing protein [Deltaproteobacteria bacterium]
MIKKSPTIRNNEIEGFEMYNTLMNALAVGYERIVAWADILDRINVYPVPDGDTGRNLVITLGACRSNNGDSGAQIREFLLSARGNSGNIVAGFLAGLLTCKDLASLPASVEAGRNLAYRAVPNPQQGTMISLFDTLATSLKRTPPEETGIWVESVIHDMEKAVKNTRDQLPELKKAGVVDAGALGMLVFLDPFLNTLAGRAVKPSLFMDDLKDSYNLSETWQDQKYQGYCVDVLLKVQQQQGEIIKHIMDVGESVVAMPDGDCFKVHLHARDRERVKQDLTAIGAILNWAEDDLAEQTSRFNELRENQTTHIMTDAAGSITRDLAQRLGITLLNSYIAVGDRFLPETYIDPSQFFAAMKAGAKVSTSQASIAERHECYNNVMKLHDRVLYLCVGSFYTGNYNVAVKWKADHDPENRMTIIDTGVASGKLGLLARAVAELALTVSDLSEIVAFVRGAIQNVHEYIFLNRLQFLAAGGRMSKTGAFFGDALHIKPIISPYPDGARKIGVVRNSKDQVKFAFRRLEQRLSKDQKVTLLLEYSDNREWLEREVKPEIERRFPWVQVIMQLLSLTSAAHMGPGSWGIAFLTEYTEKDDSHA